MGSRFFQGEDRNQTIKASQRKNKNPPGVCGNDPGMPVTRRRRKIEKQQKPQVSLLGTPVQEPCSLQIKAKDERLGVLTSNSGHEA